MFRSTASRPFIRPAYFPTFSEFTLFITRLRQQFRNVSISVLVRIMMQTDLTLYTLSKINLDYSNKVRLKYILLLEIDGIVQFGFLTHCSETDLPEAV